jgi:hypothetical protein
MFPPIEKITKKKKNKKMLKAQPVRRQSVIQRQRAKKRQQREWVLTILNVSCDYPNNSFSDNTLIYRPFGQRSLTLTGLMLME